MKKLSVVLAVALVALLPAYPAHAQALVVRQHVEGAANAEDIIADIEIPLSEMVRGIVDRDAQLIFGIFADPQTSRYIRDGAIYDSISEAESIYAKRFAKQDHSLQRSFAFLSKEFDIIDPATVLFTGIGRLESEGYQPQVIAYTILWVFDGDAWKALNMHISWK